MKSDQLEIFDRGNPEQASFIYLHGCPGSPFDLSSEIRFGLESQHRFISYWRPGFGKSKWMSAGDHSIQSHANLLKSILDDRGISSTTLIAHSLAAGIALKFALQNARRVDGMILISPWAYLSHQDKISRFPTKAYRFPGVAKLFGAPSIRKRMELSQFPRPINADQIDQATSIYSTVETLEAIGEEKNAFISEMSELQYRWKELKCPLAMIASPNDQVTFLEEQALRLHKDIPSSLLLKDPRAGHFASHIRPAQFQMAKNHLRTFSWEVRSKLL